MHLLTRLAPVLLLTMLAGCVFPGVYKINVQQGNIISEEELSQLEPGMSRSQVRSVLGTPMMLNPADTSVEYYTYTFQEAGGEIREQKVIVHYDGDTFTHMEKQLLDDLPAY
ncbi:outer membrane protein assembly factor BamE [Marinobacter bryozoorum]|jgi:outer membrane protein assembly factor BamE|uniref:outer membrane protein assembly factor BamE n=1 Tax=Marinobacter bryozoorum TaxID=256324 RepID=UPI00200581AD|nr:outer membrane protein assembly factor BamE [Marinobacter bryozoorum]MCK7544006.1 outer membrane protein assembly factor BamE [Marinobacter bryozoorum]